MNIENTWSSIIEEMDSMYFLAMNTQNELKPM